MKTINLFDKEMSVEKEYDMAICVWETRGANLDNYEDVEIELGQKIYNVKILETGSVVFTLSPDSQTYIITMFPQMFGFPTDEQLIEIKKLEEIISESHDKITNIYSKIERTGYTEIP